MKIVWTAKRILTTEESGFVGVIDQTANHVGIKNWDLVPEQEMFRIDSLFLID